MLIIHARQAAPAVADDLLGHGVRDADAGEPRADGPSKVMDLPIALAAESLVDKIVEPSLALAEPVDGFPSVKAEDELAKPRQASEELHGVPRERDPMRNT